jgi:stage V sporulation protein G
MIELTNVKFFFPKNQTSKLKAIATLTFNEVLVIKNFKVIEGNKGLFLAYPSEKSLGTDQFFETVSIINSDFKEEIHSYVLEQYELECLKDINPSF